MQAGETDLPTLLRSARPTLRDGAYVFCTLPHETSAMASEAVCVFREDEGITLVLRQEIADRMGLSYESVFRWITLSVHSGLDAIGFLAAITQALAARGISTNAISAYYHDHLFVPIACAEEAFRVIQSLDHA